MKLTLSIDNLSTIRWWVDASYNTHDDCKGQTGAMMTLGKGSPMSFSRKQKLNVRSSCEGELVGIDDALPFILWLRYFIEAQGYTVEENILYQDNKSTILLANNGRWSSSKRTKHIKSRYFFVKDKIEKGELKIEHQPTEKMWSDVLTKPKQGRGFKQDRAILMNVEEDYDDDKERLRTHPSLLASSASADVKMHLPMKTGSSKDPMLHCRSVLRGDKRDSYQPRHVTWQTGHHRVDTNDGKARVRHLELVKARIARARDARDSRNNKMKPKGLE
jgi:hypothetical protein